MKQVQYLAVQKDDADRRLDNFLGSAFPSLPKSLVYRIIRKGEVRVNKRRAKQNYRLQEGDLVRVPPVRVDQEAQPRVAKKHVELLRENILYDHKGIVVVNKPSGLAVHSGSGLAFGLIEVAKQLYPESKLNLVHRLDRETSGCLMLTQSTRILKEIHAQFKNRTIKKTYLALLNQRLKRTKNVNLPLESTIRGGERFMEVASSGKQAITEFEMLSSRSEATLVRAKPETGRMHQIRAHARAIGHPLLGDKRYGDEHSNRWARDFCGLRRLFLHAESIRFFHPETGRLVTVKAPLENVLIKVLHTLGLHNKLSDQKALKEH